MLEQDLVESRIDAFVDKGYYTYNSEDEYSLNPGVLGMTLKIFSMHSLLSFPPIHAYTIRDLRTLDIKIFLTDEGRTLFFSFLSTMSKELFEIVCPAFKNINHLTLEYGGTKTVHDNLRGIGGNRMVRNFKDSSLRIVLDVDNKPPFEYLKQEYIFTNTYEARTFVNKLLTYVPPSRLTLSRVRFINRGIAKEEMPLIISHKPRTYIL